MKGLMKVPYNGLDMWRIWRDKIAKRVYVEECTGSRSVGRSWKRWIDIVKECLKKRGLDAIQVRKNGPG